jgi:hypothetical protein
MMAIAIIDVNHTAHHSARVFAEAAWITRKKG